MSSSSSHDHSAMMASMAMESSALESSASVTSMVMSATSAMVSSMASSMASSMSMDMDMDMSSSTSSMASDHMNHASSSSTMDMASSTSSSMDMDHGSMDMSMNSYMTINYDSYPVVFKTLTASSGGAAFGIFCVLFFSAFFYRGLAFLAAYLEQRVFKTEVPCQNNDDTDTEAKCCDVDVPVSNNPEIANSEKDRSVLAKFFHFTPQSLYRDFIRLIITFVSAMFGYALMLAVMSFVITYFFAVVLGMAFGEIFFLRLATVMGIRHTGMFCSSLH